MTHHPNREYESVIQDLKECCCEKILSAGDKQVYHRDQKSKKKKDGSSHGLQVITKGKKFKKKEGKSVQEKKENKKERPNEQKKIKQKIICKQPLSQDASITKIRINYTNKPKQNQTNSNLLSPTPSYSNAFLSPYSNQLKSRYQSHDSNPKYQSSSSYKTLYSTKYSPFDEDSTPSQSFHFPPFSRTGTSISGFNLGLESEDQSKRIKDFDDVREVNTVIEGSMGTINEEMSEVIIDESFVEWAFSGSRKL